MPSQVHAVVAEVIAALVYVLEMLNLQMQNNGDNFLNSMQE